MTEITAPHPALQNALFCYATGTDGASAILLSGWDALVAKVEEEVACGPDEQWRDLLADLDEWQQDGNGVPHLYTCDFEDGYMSIYTVSVNRTLTDDQCDQIAAQAMDRVAAAKGMHALEINPDITGHHTLRRALIRAGWERAHGGGA